MRKILILLSFISLLYIINIPKEETIIPDEAIRFRVIASSNSNYDQNVKIQVRNEVENKILSLISNSKTINETRTIINNNKDYLEKLVDDKLKEINYDKKFKINYGLNYFPEKKYKGIKYKKGYYESLVITLGDGDGDNFWCVLFPPLCLVEETDSNNTEYSFFIKEILDKYLNK